MKVTWKGSLGLSLGLLVSGAQGADRPAGPRIIATTQPAEKPLAAAVTMQRPVAVASTAAPVPDVLALPDPELRPASYSVPPPLPPIIRSQKPEAPRPLPPGPVLGQDINTTPVQDKGVPAPTPVPDKDAPKSSDNPVPETLRIHPTPVDGPTANKVIVDDCGTVYPEGEYLGCFDQMRCCGPVYRWYGSAEYLLWWIKNSQVPALVTTGSPTDPVPGALVFPSSTAVLFGGSLDNDERSGGRFRLGYWFNDDRTLGLEAGFFFLGQRSLGFSAGSGGLPILTRPFFDANPEAMGEAVQFVANPLLPQLPTVPANAGRISIDSSSQLWGAELNLRSNLWCGPRFSFDLLGGFRFLSLRENLGILEDIVVTAPGEAGPPAGTRIVVSDSFSTKNQFYGEQIGAVLELRRNRWFIDLTGKCALGLTRETVGINGYTAFTLPGTATSVASGGLLAQPTNIGRYSRDIFAVVPEVGVSVGYQITDSWRAFVGYNFLYWSNVVRPGDQIDRVVNSTQLPQFDANGRPVARGPLTGPPRPAFAFNSTDFFAHGLTFGMELRY
jgi:hypothetical protein